MEPIKEAWGFMFVPPPFHMCIPPLIFDIEHWFNLV